MSNHDPLRARLGTTLGLLACGFFLGDLVDTRIGPYLCRPNCPQRIKFVIRLSLVTMRPKHSELIPKVVMKQVREAHITSG
jgi:hypothetical protein